MAKPKTEQDWLILDYELNRLFNGAPVAEEELFAGRTAEVRRMLEAVLDRGKHAVLFR